MIKKIILTAACLCHLSLPATPQDSSQVMAQGSTIRSLIALAPPLQQQALHQYLDGILNATNRSQDAIIGQLREFVMTKIAPATSEKTPDKTEQVSIDAAYLTPIYKVLGVIGVCAAAYLFVVFLQNSQARKQLRTLSDSGRYDRDGRMLTADQNMMKSVSWLSKVFSRAKSSRRSHS